MALHFELLASNAAKNETGKIKKFTGNKFSSKVFIRVPGTYKKHLQSFTKYIWNLLGFTEILI